MRGLSKSIGLPDVQHASAAVARIAVRTPVLLSPALSDRTLGRSVWLKLENLQVTGSFKVRGAAARIAALDGDERTRGIVTCSSGNHGKAVSYVAEQLGIQATIVVPEWVDGAKLEAIHRHGADTILYGATYDEAEEHSLKIQDERNLVYVHPFDDPLVIAGQGTIGLELMEQMHSVTTIVVPLSGGGLIGGVAAAVKGLQPTVRVVAASAENANVMYQSIAAGKLQAFPERETIASALAGGIRADNHLSFSLVRDLVDDHVLVSENEIRDAMRFAASQHNMIVEGGGAVALAALLHSKLADLSGEVVLVVSGGNIDPSLFTSILAG